jgi:hypothetical protein
MPAEGLGWRQRSCWEARASWRSWRKRPDSTAGRRDGGTSVPALPREAVNEEGPTTGRYAPHQDRPKRAADGRRRGGLRSAARRRLFLGCSGRQVSPDARRVRADATSAWSPFAGGGGSAVPDGTHPGTVAHLRRSHVRSILRRAGSAFPPASGSPTVTTIRTTRRPRTAAAPSRQRDAGRRSSPARKTRRHPTLGESAQTAIWESEGGRLAR